MFPVIKDERFAHISDVGQNTNIESVQLRKVQLLDKGLIITFEAKVHNHDTEENDVVKYPIESSISPDQDLVDCFKRLGVHMGVMSEYIPRTTKGLVAAMKGDEKPEWMEPFRARSVIFKGDEHDEQRGVTITGYRRLEALGGVSNMVMPFVKLDTSKTKYNYVAELETLLDDLRDEVKLYLGGKQAQALQVEIGFSSDEDPKEKVA